MGPSRPVSSPLLVGLSVAVLSGLACAEAEDRTEVESGPVADCDHCPVLVVVPAGSFQMGDVAGVGDEDESPVREVAISEPFAMSHFPITVQEFRAFVEGTGHDMGTQCYGLEDEGAGNWLEPGFPQTDTDPVVCVNWNDAEAYVAWLSEQTGQAYRLPSEAEWEYAARGGSSSLYGFGDDQAMLCRYSNGADATIEDFPEEEADYWAQRNLDCTDGFGLATSPVGTYEPNAFGLYDMVGNVWEWVADCRNDTHGSYDVSPTDGSPVTQGDCTRMANRGGSWDDRPWNLRIANRGANDRTTRYNALGFRVARAVE